MLSLVDPELVADGAVLGLQIEANGNGLFVILELKAVHYFADSVAGYIDSADQLLFPIEALHPIAVVFKF